MLIVGQIAEACSEPCQTSNMNLFAKVINGYKGESKTISNIWYGAFSQVVLATEVNSESWQIFMMELLCFYKQWLIRLTMIYLVLGVPGVPSISEFRESQGSRRSRGSCGPRTCSHFSNMPVEIDICFSTRTYFVLA